MRKRDARIPDSGFAIRLLDTHDHHLLASLICRLMTVLNTQQQVALDR